MRFNRRDLFVWGGLSAVTATRRPVVAGPAAPGLPVRRSALVRVGVDGSIRWQTPVPLGPDEQGSEVVVGRGRVLLGQGGALRSFDPVSGAVGWVRELGGSAGQLLPPTGWSCSWFCKAPAAARPGSPRMTR